MSAEWAIVSDAGDIVAAFTSRAHVETAMAGFGAGYTVIRCGEETGIRVVHTWRCYVRIDDGEIELWPPFILIDRTRLSRGPETPEDDELVEIDEKASELETIVNGRPVYHLFAYATDPDRARELAQERAEQLARQ